MSGHINKVHGIHLFGYCLLTFNAWGTKVEVQISNQDGMRTHRARAPGLIDIRQCFQVRGGNITPNDKKMDGTHIKYKEITLAPKIFVSSTSYELVTVKARTE
jgi:hypothetical protein